MSEESIFVKNDSKNSNAGATISEAGLLQVCFIVLKVIGKIDWSWWWVFSPTWISILLVLLIVFLVWLCTRN